MRNYRTRRHVVLLIILVKKIDKICGRIFGSEPNFSQENLELIVNSNLEDQIKQELYNDFESLKDYISYKKLNYELFKQNKDLWPDFRESLLEVLAQEEQPAEEQTGLIQQEPIEQPAQATQKPSEATKSQPKAIAKDDIGVVEAFDDFGPSTAPSGLSKPSKVIQQPAATEIEEKPLPVLQAEDIVDFEPARPTATIGTPGTDSMAFNSNGSSGIPKMINPSRPKTPQVVDNTKKPSPAPKPPVIPAPSVVEEPPKPPVLIHEESFHQHEPEPAPVVDLVQDDHFFDDWHDPSPSPPIVPPVVKPPSQKDNPVKPPSTWKPTAPTPPVVASPTTAIVTNPIDTLPAQRPPIPTQESVPSSKDVAQPGQPLPQEQPFDRRPQTPTVIPSSSALPAADPTVSTHTWQAPAHPDYFAPPVIVATPELPVLLPIARKDPLGEAHDSVLPLPVSVMRDDATQHFKSDGSTGPQLNEKDLFQSYSLDQKYHQAIGGPSNKVVKIGHQTDLAQKWPGLADASSIHTSGYGSASKTLKVSTYFSKGPQAQEQAAPSRKLNVSTFMSNARIPGEGDNTGSAPHRAKVSVLNQKTKIDLDILPMVETIFKASTFNPSNSDVSKQRAINHIKSQFHEITTEEEKEQLNQSTIRRIRLDPAPPATAGNWSKKGKCIKIDLEDPHASRPVANPMISTQPKLSLKIRKDGNIDTDKALQEFQQATSLLKSIDAKPALRPVEADHKQFQLTETGLLPKPEDRYKWSGFVPPPKAEDLFQVDPSRIAPSILNPFDAYFEHVQNAVWLMSDPSYQPKLAFVKRAYADLLASHSTKSLDVVETIIEPFESLHTAAEQEVLFVDVVDAFCDVTKNPEQHSSRDDPVVQQRRSALRAHLKQAREEVVFT